MRGRFQPPLVAAQPLEVEEGWDEAPYSAACTTTSDKESIAHLVYSADLSPCRLATKQGGRQLELSEANGSDDPLSRQVPAGIQYLADAASDTCPQDMSKTAK